MPRRLSLSRLPYLQRYHPLRFLSHHRHSRSFPERCALSLGISVPRSTLKTFRALLPVPRNTPLPPPLPSNTHRSFDDILDCFETITLSNRMERIKCVVVAIRRYILTRAIRRNVLPCSDTSAEVCTDKVRRCKQKKVKVELALSPSTADNSQEVSVPSSSQIVLGK